MTKSRLAILIDSLASGGEVFSSYAGDDGRLNEMDVVLNVKSVGTIAMMSTEHRFTK